MEKIFSNEPEPVTKELRAYIEDWGKIIWKIIDQRSCIHFLEKYGGLYIYDIDLKNRYVIYNEDIRFTKGYWYDLINNPDNPDGNSTDHEYFLIRDDLFGRILSMEQNTDIALKLTPKDLLL